MAFSTALKKFSFFGKKNKESLRIKAYNVEKTEIKESESIISKMKSKVKKSINALFNAPKKNVRKMATLATASAVLIPGNISTSNNVSSTKSLTDNTSKYPIKMVAPRTHSIYDDSLNDKNHFNETFTIINDTVEKNTKPSTTNDDFLSRYSQLKDTDDIKDTNDTFEKSVETKQIIAKTEIPDFSNFLKGELVKLDSTNKIYNIIWVNKSSLALRDIMEPEGSTLKFVKLNELKGVNRIETVQDVTPAYIFEFFAKLKNIKPRKGWSATKIAKKLGLKEWGKDLLFDGDETFHDATKIPAKQFVYGLPDAKISKMVVEKFQDFLQQFVPGEKYLITPKEDRTLECEIRKIVNGKVIVWANDNGKSVEYVIEPHMWGDFSFMKAPITDAELENIENRSQLTTKINGDQKKKKHLHKEKMTFVEPDKNIRKKELLTDVFKNTEIEPQKDNIKISKNVLNEDKTLLKKLTRSYFKGDKNVNKLTNDSKDYMVRILTQTIERAEKVVSNAKLHPKLLGIVEKYESIIGDSQTYLKTIGIAESGFLEKYNTAILDNNNKLSLSFLQQQIAYIKKHIKTLEKLLGNIPDVYRNLKLDQIQDIHDSYGKTPEFYKKIKELKSPIFEDAGILGNLVLAATADLLQQIDQQMAEYMKNPLYQNVKLTPEDIRLMLFFHYNTGKSLVDTPNKSGRIGQYLRKKINEPELTAEQWLTDNYNELTEWTIERKESIWQLTTKMSEIKKTKEAELISAISKLHQTVLDQMKKNSEVNLDTLVNPKKIPNTQENRNLVLKHSTDLNKIKKILSNNNINTESSKIFIKLIVSGLINNPGTNTKKVIDGFLSIWENKMLQDGKHESLVKGLRNISKHITNTEKTEHDAIEKVDMPGEIILTEISQKIRKELGKKFKGFVDEVAKFEQSVNPRNLFLQPETQISKSFV